ncbi:DUF2975 domain-containing protein [Nocardiopsis sp. CNT-189]|uniref:DUF2975 domain-containing protein n=1 Tax=Nocardiopsis oceanisediminis TaxID=2816862 RepID=UPI003B2B72BD
MRMRNTWLEGLQAVTALAVVLLALGLAALAVTVVSGMLGKPIPLAQPVAVEVPADMVEAAPPPGTGLDRDVEVTVGDPAPVQYLLYGIPALTGSGMLLAGAVLLNRALKAALREPFSRAVVALLRALGMLAVLGVLVQALVESAAGMLLMRSVLPAGGLFLTYDVPLGVLLFGVGMLAAAGIIRRGAVMRDDLEGTV